MLNCVIVGCGKIAGGYDSFDDDNIRTHAKAFTKNPDCSLIGVCDNDLLTVTSFADTWKVPFSTTDPEKLLLECKPDIISICSPTETHEDLFDLACSKRVPYVWLEKPAADSMAAVERMKVMANSTETKVWVNYYRRYDKGFRLLKDRLEEYGKVRHVQALYTKGIRHNGSHMIELCMWLFGDISDVYVEEILDDPVFPSVTAKLKANKVDIDLIALDYNAYEIFELDILSDKGRIRVLDGGQKMVFEHVISDKYYSGYKNLDVEYTHIGTYGKFMEAGLSLALNEGVMPSLDDEIAIHKVLDKIETQIYEMKSL